MQNTTAVNNRHSASVMDRMARAALNSLSDHMLVLLGFSPLRVRRGIAGMPWRLAPQARRQARAAEREIRWAVAELRQYSDAELSDLGLSRRNIERAVRFGRPGIDDTVGRVSSANRESSANVSDFSRAA